MFTHIHGYILRLMVLHVLPFIYINLKSVFFNFLDKTFSYIIKLG